MGSDSAKGGNSYLATVRILLSLEGQSVLPASAVSVTTTSLDVVFEERTFAAGCRWFRADGVVAAPRFDVVAFAVHTEETKLCADAPGGVRVNSGMPLTRLEE